MWTNHKQLNSSRRHRLPGDHKYSCSANVQRNSTFYTCILHIEWLLVQHHSRLSLLSRRAGCSSMHPGHVIHIQHYAGSWGRYSAGLQHSQAH